jgi:hypothetical protein
VKIYYAGAEVSSHRSLLSEAGIETVSLSYMGLRRRIKHPLNWSIADHFSGQQVFLDSGAYTVNRSDDEYSEDELLEIASEYMEFVRLNLDSLVMASEFDAQILGQEWIGGTREDFWNDLGDKFLPIWHSDLGTDELEALATRYPRVGVLQAGVADHTALLNRIVTRHGTRLHGVSMTQVDAMKGVRWDSVGSMSWLAPMTNGETIVWNGRELKRYPKKSKDSCRKRYRSWFTDSGFDADLIADDSTPEGKKELLRLSLWSYEKLVGQINLRSSVATTLFGNGGETVAANPGFSENEENPDPGGSPVDTHAPESRSTELVPTSPRKRENRTLLPIIGVQSGGDEDDDSAPQMRSSSRTLLACDNCFIKDKCPEFSAGSECAFDIPASIRTMPERIAIWDTLIEVQIKRTLQMAMIEQVEGGYADANTSSEIDRTNRMLKSRADAEKQGFTITQTVSANASAGMLSNIFGDKAGSQMAALPAPQTPEQIMEDAGIIDIPDEDVSEEL